MGIDSLVIIGPGRAGRSFAGAFESVGLHIELIARGEPVEAAARNADAVLIATPDRTIAWVASAIAPSDAVIMHCSGATGLDALGDHERVASIHPLMALPNPTVGAARLVDHGWFATAGDGLAPELVKLLGGRSFSVDDDRRALYHATAAVSANHLVALLGQVERLASQAQVPVQAFFDLAQGSFDDVVEHGAAASLTGPAARGDTSTLEAHRAALPAEEVALYDALAAAAHDLAAGTSGSDPGVPPAEDIPV